MNLLILEALTQNYLFTTQINRHCLHISSSRQDWTFMRLLNSKFGFVEPILKSGIRFQKLVNQIAEITKSGAEIAKSWTKITKSGAEMTKSGAKIARVNETFTASSLRHATSSKFHFPIFFNFLLLRQDCSKCHTKGKVNCQTCEGHGQIRCFIQLSITWKVK